MENKTMTPWGMGPKMVRGSIITAIVIYTLQSFLFPSFKIPISQQNAFMFGGFWFVLGIPIWFNGAKEINKNFKKNKLVTTGVFRYIQHPIYTAFCLFYIPAIVFMSRSWVGFILPIVFYILFKKYISIEEQWLEKKFGEKYKNNTGEIFPKF